MAVPHLWLLVPQLFKIRIDLGTELVRERPRRRFIAQIEPRQRNDRDLVHAPAWSQPRMRGSSLDRALAYDHGTAADGCAGQLAGADLQGQLHQAWAAHLVALLDREDVLAIWIDVMGREIARKRRGRRTRRRVFGNACSGSEHARVKCVPRLRRLPTDDECGGVRVEPEGLVP